MVTVSIHMGWLAAGADYEVSLERGKVVARNRQGRLLKSLPKALRGHRRGGRLAAALGVVEAA
ncbi:hypothetical protein [Micromonospora sp. NPDC048839]|uniref:hypothetical protein n=1 Tax=Micromonospora sp. NPDC048839 TaxID=3155641 RepID=UPI00340F78BB